MDANFPTSQIMVCLLYPLKDKLKIKKRERRTNRLWLMVTFLLDQDSRIYICNISFFLQFGFLLHLDTSAANSPVLYLRISQAKT